MLACGVGWGYVRVSGVYMCVCGVRWGYVRVRVSGVCVCVWGVGGL